MSYFGYELIIYDNVSSVCLWGPWCTVKKNLNFSFFLLQCTPLLDNLGRHQKDTNIGQDLTVCQLLLIFTSVKSDQKAIGICQSLCKTCLQNVIAQFQRAM